MGKKRVAQKGQRSGVNRELRSRALQRAPKKKLDEGILHVLATYNNTHLTFTDTKGNVIMWTSAGAMGFKGARKSTPYAAAKASELLVEKAKMMGVKSIGVRVKGVGSGRESAVRAFLAGGMDLSSIEDVTPLPHNGPKPPRPRRV